MLAATVDTNCHSESLVASSEMSSEALLESSHGAAELHNRDLSAQSISKVAENNIAFSTEVSQTPPYIPNCTKEDAKVVEHEPNFLNSNLSESFSNFPSFASILSESKNIRLRERDTSLWTLEKKMENFHISTSIVSNNVTEKKEDMKYSYLATKNHPNTVGLSMFSNSHNFNISALNDIRGLSSCFSSMSTHFISVGLLPQDIDANELEFLKNTGKIWHIYTDRIHDLGMLIVAYYDLRDAISTVKQLRSTRIRGGNVTVNYIRISQLVKCPSLYNSFKNINDFEGKLLLSYCPPNQFSSNMQLILESCGEIREISQLPYKSSIVVEYYDVRHAVAAEEKLHRMDPQGIQYQVNFYPDEDYVEKIVIFHDYQQDTSGSFAQQGYIQHSKNDLIPDIWTREHPTTNKLYGKYPSGAFYPIPDSQPTYPGQQFPISAANPKWFADPYPPTTMLPGLQYDSRIVTNLPKVRDQKTSMNYTSTSYAPSNMPRFSSNSSSCENVVPGRNQVDVWRIIQGFDNRTTFMIRNIPNKYTQKMLLECIDETHRGEYDFVYLRMDFKNHCNVGYAFINFIDVNAVISFIEKRVGRKWGRFNSDKICHISYANIQGKNALMEKFKNSSVMEKDPTYRPKIFYSSGPFKGLEEPFPVYGTTTSGSIFHDTVGQWMPHSSVGKWKDHESDTDSGICNSFDEKIDMSYSK